MAKAKNFGHVVFTDNLRCAEDSLRFPALLLVLGTRVTKHHRSFWSAASSAKPPAARPLFEPLLEAHLLFRR